MIPLLTCILASHQIVVHTRSVNLSQHLLIVRSSLCSWQQRQHWTPSRSSSQGTYDATAYLPAPPKSEQTNFTLKVFLTEEFLLRKIRLNSEFI